MSESRLGVGTAELRSAGPITIGPDGILFMADNVTSTIFAVDVADTAPDPGPTPLDLADVNVRVA